VLSPRADAFQESRQAIGPRSQDRHPQSIFQSLQIGGLLPKGTLQNPLYFLILFDGDLRRFFPVRNPAVGAATRLGAR
jgi:hypothetical protein